MFQYSRRKWKCMFRKGELNVCIKGTVTAEMYLRTRTHSEVSDQTAHSRSLIRTFIERILGLYRCKGSSCRQQTLIRLHECTVRFESSLCAHIRSYHFSRCGSNIYRQKSSSYLTGFGWQSEILLWSNLICGRR